MRGVRKTLAAAALIWGVAAAPLLCPPAASALDAAAEQAQIGKALQAGYQQSYSTKDPAGILALYDAKAEIVTFTAGRVDKAAFATLLGTIFKGWRSADANVTIEKSSFPSESEALITFHLQVTGTSAEGKPTVRQDRLHAALRRDGKGWLILKQGYRENFGISTSPHDKMDQKPAAGHDSGGWH
jgi:ketosteroid isomerase-like protein